MRGAILVLVGVFINRFYSLWLLIISLTADGTGSSGIITKHIKMGWGMDSLRDYKSKHSIL